jgi:putative ABC transport system permease protein
MTVAGFVRWLVDTLFKRRQMEGEMSEELKFHLDSRAQDLVNSGLSPAEAMRQARLEFGGMEGYKEQCREARGTNYWDEVRRNVLYATRMARKSRGFTALVIVVLALGIGVNASIFSVVNAALLRPLPYREPGKLVTIGETRAQFDVPNPDSSYPDYVDWTRQAQSFESIAGYSGDGATFTGAGAPEMLDVGRVTANFFSTLGVKPALGRDFVAADDLTDGPKIVMVSYRFWKEHLGSNANVIGEVLHLDGEGYAIIGVLPSQFEFAPMDSPPVWVPLRPNHELAARRNLRWMHAIARPRNGVSSAQAFAEMRAITARLALAYPQEDGAVRLQMGALREQIVGQVRPLLLILFGAVSLVLLIACANVANLLLSRGTARKREIAVRMALGASRGQLIRQFLTESLLLALAGGALGLLASPWCVSLMVRGIPKDQLASMPYLSSVHIDPAVLAFTFLIAAGTALVFGLAPALDLSRADMNQNLKEEARGSAGSGASRLRSVLVVAELSLALMLLVGAGLLLKSVTALFHADPGFDTNNLLTFSIDLPSIAYKDDAAALAFEQRFTGQLRSLPGVEGVATVSVIPLTGGGNSIRFVVEGRPVEKGHEDECFIRSITADYFKVMKVPLGKGRFFASTDGRNQKGALPVLMVNRAFARRYFPNEDALGKRIRFTYSPQNPFAQIVGIVGDENAGQPGAPPAPVIYTFFDQSPDSFLNVVVRTAGNPLGLMGPIRGVLNSDDPELPMIEPQTMEQIIESSPAVFLRRYPSFLIGSFAALALGLALVGLYGVISFSVAQRTREIGIRMALGAVRRDVLRIVLRQGLLLAVAGVGCGVAGGLLLTRFLGSLLYGVRPTDPVTFAAVSALLIAVALVASYVPARRATQVDPIVALRYE